MAGLSASLSVRLEQLRLLASLTPFDLSTEEGRANQRHRRILVAAATSALAKIVSIATTFISIPLTLHYLGPERFGLWVTMSSVIAMLGFADLGIGNGLLNAVSAASGRDDVQSIKRLISSAFAVLTTIAAVILVVFLVIHPFVPWARFFNVKSPEAVTESAQAVAIFMVFFVMNIPADIVQRTQAGLQLGFAANLWQIAGSLGGLVAVLVVIHLQLGLPWLVGALTGLPVAIALVNGYVFFRRIRPDICPSWRMVDSQAAKTIAHTGILFFVLQISFSLAFVSNNIIISQIMGPEAVAQYAVSEKLFSPIPTLLAMALTPLWPAYGEAMARGDGAWIKRIFLRSLKISLALSLGLAALTSVFADKILAVWVGQYVTPTLTLLLGFVLWKVFEAWGIAVSMFLNGANIMKLQATLAIVMAVSAVALKIVLVQQIGIAGVVWGTIIAYGALNLVPLSLALPGILRKYTQQKTVTTPP